MNDGMARDGKRIFTVILLLMLTAFAGVLFDPVHDKRQFSALLFIRQDLVVALGIALLIRYGLAVSDDGKPPHWMDVLHRSPWLLPLALLLLCWVGRHWLLLDYDLTRDEQMARFDARIFAHVRLFWPIAPQWRPMAEALNQFFMLPIADRQAWISGYLPINALARAWGDAGLISALFTAVGAIALWRIAERLWPGDAGARTVALLLYAGSSQVVVQGMTAHAMAGHLGLNLLWLALFLRGGRWGHAGAILLGFFATGLHQPLFHPLFVLPILTGLLIGKRWSLAGIYAIAYIAIGLFWLAWPNMIAQLAGGPMAALSGTGDRLSYADRILDMIGGFGFASLWLMAMNLLRFVAWQHVLLLPLVIAGVRLAWQEMLVRPLVAGVVLHIMMVGLLLAFQGHGWGYRYLHGVIGSLCLLGAYGWRALKGRWPGSRMWGYANGATFCLLLPLHMAMAAGLTLPYARVSAQIDNVPASVAIVDEGAVAFGSDLVFNRPDLSNRPIRLLAGSLTADQVANLCTRETVAFIGTKQMQPIADILDAEPSGTAHFLALQRACATLR